MANKFSGTVVVVVSSLAVITFLGYLLMRKSKATIPAIIPTTKDQDKNSIFNAGQGIGDIIANTPMTLQSIKPASGVPFELYAIKTSGSNLNLRDKPATSGKVLKSLEPFISVYARPSSVKGWMEVSEDGKQLVGYASSGYLRKL
jgi:hypothetical protein